jgi:hypothetical protein
MNDAPGVLVVLLGAGVAFLGLLQYVSAFFQNNSKKRTQLFDEVEVEKRKNIQLSENLDKLRLKCAEISQQKQLYYRLYKKYEKKYADAAKLSTDEMVEQTLDIQETLG